jgi:dihydrofolate synthase/folylpolyglutamate synthase
MSYASTLEYIHSVKWRGSKPGLSRTKALLEAIGHPEKRLKFVHIAGTNGKGSTAACIASILQAAGYRVGLYTSPFIIRFNERMQVNGLPISDVELEQITDFVRPHADAMDDPPTEFELITAVAMEFFVRNACDIVVLEVGMGGELDSTNVIDTPVCAVITAMGLDHTRELGSTIADIAQAKAGIIKSDGDVVVYGNEPEANRVFEQVCLQRNAHLRYADFSRLHIHGFGIDGCHFDFDVWHDLTLPLVGTYQPYNAAVAITAVQVLRGKGWQITDDDVRNGLQCVRWPGRFEILHRDPVFILDGAHNPHGISATSASLAQIFPGQKVVFLMGVMADKALGQMLPYLKPLADQFVCVTPENPRSLPAQQLAERIREVGMRARACDTIDEGTRCAIALAGTKGVVCALGSLYFSADVRRAVVDFFGQETVTINKS